LRFEDLVGQGSKATRFGSNAFELAFGIGVAVRKRKLFGGGVVGEGGHFMRR